MPFAAARQALALADRTALNVAAADVRTTKDDATVRTGLGVGNHPHQVFDLFVALRNRLGHLAEGLGQLIDHLLDARNHFAQTLAKALGQIVEHVHLELNHAEVLLPMRVGQHPVAVDLRNRTAYPLKPAMASNSTSLPM